MSEPDDTFGARLRSLHSGNGLGKKKESRLQFAKRIGESDTTLGNYERDERVPNAEFLARLRQQTGVDLNWLISGEGEGAFPATPDKLLTLPVLGVDTAGNLALGSGLVAMSASWLRERGFDTGSIAVLIAPDDSHEPAIRRGDLLFVQLATETPRANGLYVEVAGVAIVVRRVDLGDPKARKQQFAGRVLGHWRAV